MKDGDKFACAINCMDGRVQDAVTRYFRKRYRVKWVDQVTEPGPCRILAENRQQHLIDNIRERVRISVDCHGSEVVAIVAHHGCAGNSVRKEEQLRHLRKAYETVKSFGFNVDVILLWVEGDWINVEEYFCETNNKPHELALSIV